MLLQMFTVYDSKAECYSKPFLCVARGEAIRSFVDIANDVGSAIGAHPSDYTLFHIGEFDDAKASITTFAHISLGCAIEFVKSSSPATLLEQANTY